jgi:hypothetical protein
MLGLSSHGGEELEWLGCGSGEWLGWLEEEGGTGVILPPTFSPSWCYEPTLKGNTSRD